MNADTHQPVRIVILASGSGSNAQKVIERFRDDPNGEVVAVLTNKKDAGVLARASHLGVQAQVMTREIWSDGDALLDLLSSLKTDLVVLAGYLKLIPDKVVRAFEGRMVNIHPALLPAYGGQGMYGGNVHRAVIANQEPESGITIHLVNEVYDQGKILKQVKLAIQPGWGPDELQEAIHQLEHQYFPEVVADLAAQIIHNRKN